jgi:hypothetical protein
VCIYSILLKGEKVCEEKEEIDERRISEKKRKKNENKVK